MGVRPEKLRIGERGLFVEYHFCSPRGVSVASVLQ